MCLYSSPFFSLRYSWCYISIKLGTKETMTPWCWKPEIFIKRIQNAANELKRKTGLWQRIMNVKLLHQMKPNEIYSKSICILFKQQFVSSLPCLILYSLFCFKFPKGIIININWSLYKHKMYTERSCTRNHNWE